MKKIIFLFGILCSLSGQSQVLDSIIQFNGKEYCLHKIQTGETLYQLSRTYNVAYSIVKESNPDRGDELALGDLVRIPCKYTKVDRKVPFFLEKHKRIIDSLKAIDTSKVEMLPQGYIWHEVQPKETVYSLSRKYKISELRLKIDNPIIKEEGLKAGSSIKIFTGEVNAELDTNSVLTTDIVVDSAMLADTSVFRLGLLLPFNFEKNKEQMNKTKESDEGALPVVLNQTRIFVEFYQGVKAAVDSLSQLGTNIQLFVFDTKSDSIEIQRLSQRQDFKSLHMIVGPAFNHNFNFASRLLKNSPVKLVSPYGKDSGVVKGNPNVIKVHSAKESREKLLALELYQKHHDSNLVLVYDSDEEKLLLEKMQQEILSLSLLNDSALMSTPVIVQGIYEPLSKLKVDENNVVVTLSTRESFATKLIAKLQSRQQDYQITVFGMEEWKDYKNIEVLHWESLNIHVVGNLDFRYSAVQDSSFFKKYFVNYSKEPSYHAVLGYETVIKVLSGLEGVHYKHSQIVGKSMVGDLSRYLFKYSGELNGIENQASTIYKFKDFKFEKQSE